jgi:hypothetical protein
MHPLTAFNDGVIIGGAAPPQVVNARESELQELAQVVHSAKKISMR